MANKIGTREAILSLVPTATFSILTTPENEETITWGEPVAESDRPTQAEIKAEITRLEAEYDAQEYARNRKSEYPTVAELTVALYDTDDKAALETKRAAVKTKWPKDNSGPVE